MSVLSKGMEMDSWRPFLRQLIEEQGIRRIFAGDFIVTTGSPSRKPAASVLRPGFEAGLPAPELRDAGADRVNARSTSTSPRRSQGLPQCDQLPQNIV